MPHAGMKAKVRRTCILQALPCLAVAAAEEHGLVGHWYDYSVYLPDGVELRSCAPLTEVNFHRYEDWIPLKFVK